MDKEKGGRLVFMPDIEYRAWVNRNRAALNEIIDTGRVPGFMISKEPNRSFLIRYLKECGYSITFK